MIIIIIIIIILFFNKSACNRTAVDNYKFIRNTANLVRHAGQPQLVQKPTLRPVLDYSWGPVPGVGEEDCIFSQPGPNTQQPSANRQLTMNENSQSRCGIGTGKLILTTQLDQHRGCQNTVSKAFEKLQHCVGVVCMAY